MSDLTVYTDPSTPGAPSTRSAGPPRPRPPSGTWPTAPAVRIHTRPAIDPWHPWGYGDTMPTRKAAKCPLAITLSARCVVCEHDGEECDPRPSCEAIQARAHASYKNTRPSGGMPRALPVLQSWTPQEAGVHGVTSRG